MRFKELITNELTESGLKNINLKLYRILITKAILSIFLENQYNK